MTSSWWLHAGNVGGKKNERRILFEALLRQTRVWAMLEMPEGGRRMKPSYQEFLKAYVVIMQYIETEPKSRKLFHALLSFRMHKYGGEEE